MKIVSLGMLILLISSVVHAEDVQELTEKNFKASKGSKSVLVLNVNWGRKWGCAGLDNAQLERLSFKRMHPAPAASIDLTTPSRLAVRDAFVPYALLIAPGDYALDSFDVKVARSVSNVGHITANNLSENGKGIGGKFTVAAGEIIYAGHIGLDCKVEAIPWRYYVEGRAAFEKYVAGFRKQFPFLKSIPVQYRLIATKGFGETYTLDGDLTVAPGTPPDTR
jgi:hypothetical protein